MSNHRSLVKFSYLIRILDLDTTHRAYPTLDEIREYLADKDFEKLSDRTIRRDINTLRNDLQIDVKYCATRRGYSIDKDNKLFDPQNYRSIVQLLNHLEQLNFLQDASRDIKTTSRNILFEQKDQFKGTQYIKPLLDAINEGREVKITHASFGREPVEYQLVPCHIMEYRNRWYLVACEKGTSTPRTYGLDRIHKITPTGKASHKPSIDIKAYYEDVFGITRLEGQQPQLVILSFTPEQGNYLKSLPMHASQEVLVDDAVEFRISLFVINNFELRKEILSHGHRVKVLEPASLREEIAEEIKKSLEFYQVGQILV